MISLAAPLANEAVATVDWSAGGVGPGRGQFVKADVSSVMDGGAILATRNCLSFLFEETLGGGE